MEQMLDSPIFWFGLIFVIMVLGKVTFSGSESKGKKK